MKKYYAEIFSLLMLVGGIVIDLQNAGWFQSATIQCIWYVIAFLPVGIPVLKEAIQHIRKKDYFNEYMLMSLATIGAFYIGEFPEGVAVMLFYSIGEIFQDYAVDKARDNISSLLDVRPQWATVIRNNIPTTASPQEIRVGEIVAIKAGEKVPLDGKMLSKNAFFNTAALTGESIPQNIQRGETVLAGMIVTDKIIQIEVTKPYDQSTLAHILELVENAAGRKAPAELFIRKFARVYTPIVTGLAFLIVFVPFVYSVLHPEFIFIFDEWLYKALVFLVISCPCALVVSIPLGYFGGIGAASRKGILFKGGNYLDAITRINTVVFDKTGTLTKGKFEIQEICTANGLSDHELLQIMASVENGSNHPIAKAIVARAYSEGIEIKQPTDIKEIAGYGLEALVNDQKILVGNSRLLDYFHISYPTEINSIPETTVLCAVNKTYGGYILLADVLKEDVPEAIAKLKNLNINNIQILSGDKQMIVSKLASRLGINDAYGDLLPDGKIKHIEALKSNKNNQVAFVGDGINDAPVLALSDVGIAMGGLGSDIAIETADIVIQTDQPSKMAMAIQIGKQTRNIVWQNVCMAFAVKIAVLALGAGGIATMWEAVFADVGVSLLAILNAIRLQKKFE